MSIYSLTDKISCLFLASSSRTQTYIGQDQMDNNDSKRYAETDILSRLQAETSKSSLKYHRICCEATKIRIRIPDGMHFRMQMEPGKRKNLFKRNMNLDSGKGCTWTLMRSIAKRNMFVGTTMRIKLPRLRKDSRIIISRLDRKSVV